MTAYRSCLQFITVGALTNQRVSQLASWNAGAFLTLQEPLYPWVDATFYTVAGAFFGSPATLRTYVNNVLQVPSIVRSEEHTSELQSQSNLVCRLLLEKKKARDKRQH